MHRKNRKIIRLAATIVGLSLAFAVPEAAAQTMMQVPQPGVEQMAPRMSPRAQATPAPAMPPSNDMLQLGPAPTPVAAQTAPPPTNAQPNPPPMITQSAPVLPKVLRGCWQGQVNLLDSLTRLPGAHKVGYWTPKTYRLCYKRVGNGPFKLTFSEAGIAPTDKVIHVHGHVDTVATDGRAYARLNSKLAFDEFRVGPGHNGGTFHVDETAILDCRIENGAMAVAASVYGTRDGAPWFRARWRALFQPVAQ